MRIAFNGLEMGDDSLYNVNSIEGLDSLPDLTIGIAPKPRRHGSWLGGKLAQKRVITMNFEIMGDPADDWRTTGPKNAMVEAFQIMDEELPLVFELGYGEPSITVNASVTALDLPIGVNYSRLRSGTVEFTCTDPTKYTAEPKSGSARLPTRPDAAVYGQPYGFAYHVTTGLTGTFTAKNTGNTPSPAVYTITGPVTSPSITLRDSKGTRRITFGLDLGVKDRLEIYTATNRVTKNGEDRYGTAHGALVSDLTIRPGSTTISFTGKDTGSTVSPTLTAQWRDASR